MHFLQPEIFYHLIWVVPFLIGISIYAHRRRKQNLRNLLGTKAAENPAFVKVSYGMRFFRSLLFFTAVLLLFCALARPSWGVHIVETGGSGRDIMVLFDVSKSMLCKDVQPSRMAHAKWVVNEVLKKNAGDRFGLVAFAGKAFMVCPLTIDTASLRMELENLSVDTIPVGGTDLEAALEQAIRAFRIAETNHRAVLLVTDGDELTGSSRVALAQLKEKKIPLLIVGVGDPAQPAIIQVPGPDGTLRTIKGRDGNFVTAPLNEKLLAQLAAETAGVYIRSTAADDGIGKIDARIKSLVPKDYALQKTTRPIERFTYPLCAAILLLLLFFALSDRAKDVVKHAAIFLFCCCISELNAAPQTTPVKKTVPEIFQDAEKALQKKDFRTAAAGFQEVLAQSRNESEIRGKSAQNLAVIAHTEAREQMGASMQAIQKQKLDDAEKKLDGALKTLTDAEELYREALRSLPENQGLSGNQTALLGDIKHAKELKKKIEELKKLQQQARKQTRQARDQQKQQNQKQNQPQKNQQQQEQKQQKQQKNQQQQQIQKAADTAHKLAQKAQDLQQKQTAENAKQAEQDIRQAAEQQKKGDGTKAEQLLNEAVKKLGSDPEKKQNKQDQKQQKQQQKQQDKSPVQAKQGQPKDKSQESAATILDSMADGEKKLRDQIRQKQQNIHRNTPVEKDW